MNIETRISTELWTAVRRSYESQAWSNAILDGIHHLSDVIRSRTGLQSDGVVLAGQALGGNSPKLRVNKLQTESDENVQRGAEQLLRGLYQAIRNPRSHRRVDDSQADADTLLLFINYLLGLIGHAKTSFSLDEAIARALDENFVPNERYSALVVEEIPSRNRLEVGLAVFERRAEANQKQLAPFFQALLERLSEEGRVEFFAALSDNLRDSSDDDLLQFTLQILQPTQWLELSEVARLRSENRLLKNLRQGWVNHTTGKCTGGALATWSRDFWPHFTLKKEFLEAATQQVNSQDPEVYAYASKFVLHYLSSLADKPPWQLQSALARRIKEGDESLYTSVKYNLIWPEDQWHKIIKDALDAYAESHPEDDDIPF